MADKKRLQITLTNEYFKKLSELSSQKGVSKSGILALALEQYIKHQENN